MSSKELPGFVQKLLQPIISENGFTNYSVNATSGCEAGDGFASELFSIAITENAGDKRLDLVCKIAPSNKNQREENCSDVLFDREALFYDKLMPTFARFQREKNVPEQDQFLSYPKCYATLIDNESENFAIILEDLRPVGFKMWPKNRPPSIENVRLVIRELGKLHGLSFAMKDQKPAEFQEFSRVRDTIKTMFKSENMQKLYKKSLDHASNSLKNDDHKAIALHIKENLMEYVNDCLDFGADDPSGALCHGTFLTKLCHSFGFIFFINKYWFLGDAWSNNMLYRFNEHVSIAEYFACATFK